MLSGQFGLSQGNNHFGVNLSTHEQNIHVNQNPPVPSSTSVQQMLMQQQSPMQRTAHYTSQGNLTSLKQSTCCLYTRIHVFRFTLFLFSGEDSIYSLHPPDV